MIANVSPGTSCVEHTLNTLRYADRVKEMKKEGEQPNKKQKPDQSRELMLARQTQNTNKIKLNQQTLMPKKQKLPEPAFINLSNMAASPQNPQM